jgi:hypothetical protein
MEEAVNANQLISKGAKLVQQTLENVHNVKIMLIITYLMVFA